jgi:hypothetical protein
MTTRWFGRALLVLAAGIALGAMARAEELAAPADKEPMACCQQMRAKQKERQAALDEKTAAMNKAQGGEKVDAIAAVVNELVAQRAAMPGDQSCAGGCSMMSGAMKGGATKPEEMPGMHGMMGTQGEGATH